LALRRDYLPLPYGGGRALVAGAGAVYYDVAGSNPADDRAVRWLKIQPVDQSRYARLATIRLGQPAGGEEEGEPIFDGKERDCLWHRLLLDGCIPPQTAVYVWSRAHDDPVLLPSLPFSREPELYLRGAGAEIPYYDPYAEKTAGGDPLPAGAGTWELLLQRARGRYLQLRLELSGNGRTTPQLRALRLYYPRFSYPARYLPAVYHDEEQPGPFLERLLANMEGFFTEVEGKMDRVAALFDPRTAPPEALDWLAGWMGLMLDPIWGQLQRKRAMTGAVPSASPGVSRLADRRRLFIRFARILYERRGTPDGIRFALQLLLEPCLEQLLDGLQRAAVERSHPLRELLAGYGLRPPTPTTSAADYEQLLYDYLLRRPSRVRLVESFLIRQGRGGVAGLPGSAGTGESGPSAFAAHAHRFTVVIPADLAAEEEAMVGRIVSLEKPAHTHFTLRRYHLGFRLDEARLGLDTTLDQSSRFVPMLIGRDRLAEGYLPASHPFTVAGRFIAGRDRLGRAPSL
jgi:hypothetical protein